MQSKKTNTLQPSNWPSNSQNYSNNQSKKSLTTNNQLSAIRYQLKAIMNLSQLDNKQKFNLATYFGGILILLFLFIFFVTSSWIGFGVKDNCNQAQLQFEGDCVEALMQTVDADFETNVSKNSAVWALGQLGDDRALPLLESKYTGIIQEEKTPYDVGLSQYELEKAIKLLKGGWNITSAFWR